MKRNIITRFIKETIFREELNEYDVYYRLDDGKYYRYRMPGYSIGEARRIFIKNIDKIRFHVEYEPIDMYKELIEDFDYVYVE